MGRNKSQKSNARKLNRHKKLKAKILFAYRKFNYYSESPLQYTVNNRVNVFTEYDQLLFEIIKSPNISIRQHHLTDSIKPVFAKSRIPVSVLVRIERWNTESLSIFSKIMSYRTHKSSDNKFELSTKFLLEQILNKYSKTFDANFNLVPNAMYSNKFYPFLMGTPDFCVFSSYWSPLCIIECKKVSSEIEFKRHVQLSKNTKKYQLKESSEYYKQVVYYLNIFLISSGILLIQHDKKIYFFKVYLKKFTSKMIEKFQNFFIEYYLPLSILNRDPVLVKEKPQYFMDSEIKEIKQYLFEKHSSLNFGRYNMIEEWEKEKRTFERYFD